MTVHHHPADGLLVQILIAYDIWPKLTPKQRDVLTRQRKVRNPEAKVPSDRFLVIGEVKAAPRTMASLKRKGVVDDRGEASGYYSDNKTTYVDFVAKRAAKEALNGELREAAQEAVAGLKEKVAAIVSDQIAEKISREVRR